MKILILGAGGVGGYFGGRLVESGADVTFLVRPAREENLKTQGLRIESPKGNSNLKIKTMTTESLSGAHFDLVILSCKAYDLQSAINAIKPAVGPQTYVLPVLNGLEHYPALDETFSAKQVLAGIVYIAVTLGAQGQIKHLNDNERFVFGAREPSQVAFCKTAAEVLSHAKFDLKLSEEIMQDAWEKFIFLTTAAAMTCLMRGSIGEITSTAHGEILMLETLRECEATSAAFNHPVQATSQAAFKKQLTDHKSTLTASMLRDLQNGSRVEADAIIGGMIKRAESKSIPSPLLKVAYTHLQVYQGRL